MRKERRSLHLCIQGPCHNHSAICIGNIWKDNELNSYILLVVSDNLEKGLVGFAHAWRKNVKGLIVLLPSIVARFAIPKPPAAGSAWPMRDLTALKRKGCIPPLMTTQISDMWPTMMSITWPRHA